MRKSTFIKLIFIVAIASSIAIDRATACPAMIHYPRPNEPERYSQIFIGRIKEVEPIDSVLSHSDLTPPYKLTLIEPVTLVGEEFQGEIVNVGAGCGWPFPKVGVMAIFFVEKKGGMILPGYGQDEGDKLTQIIELISKPQGAP